MGRELGTILADNVFLSMDPEMDTPTRTAGQIGSCSNAKQSGITKRAS